MSYEIYLKEEWSTSDILKDIISKWSWTVEFDGVPIDAGTVGFGGPVGEAEARKCAERAATLDSKRVTAKSVSYDFTPEG